MEVRIGIDIGQRRTSTGICVTERERRGTEDHFLVRHLERLEPGTRFPAMVDRASALVDSIDRRGQDRILVYLDVTGLGDPIYQLFSRSNSKAYWMSVSFNHGDRQVLTGGSDISLGKAYLVVRLQTLLQLGRLHLPKTPEAETLARDLLDYQIEVGPDDNERSGAFSVGTQDDLVTALGLAVSAKTPLLRGIY